MEPILSVCVYILTITPEGACPRLVWTPLDCCFISKQKRYLSQQLDACDMIAVRETKWNTLGQLLRMRQQLKPGLQQNAKFNFQLAR